jgi:hypothetical protein
LWLVGLEVRTTLWPLLQMDLLHTVSRVTEQKLLIVLLMVIAVLIIGCAPWQSHGDPLDLQETYKAIGVHDPGSTRVIANLLKLVIDGRACVELGLLNYHRWHIICLEHATHKHRLLGLAWNSLSMATSELRMTK